MRTGGGCPALSPAKLRGPYVMYMDMGMMTLSKMVKPQKLRKACWAGLVCLYRAARYPCFSWNVLAQNPEATARPRDVTNSIRKIWGGKPA